MVSLMLLAIFALALVLWGVVPGAAADPFYIQVAAMPGFVDDVARPESPLATFVGPALHGIYQDLSSTSARPNIPGTVRPQDLLLSPQQAQLVEGAPSTHGSLYSPPTSSGFSVNTPLQPRRDYTTAFATNSLTEANVLQHHSQNNVNIVAPRHDELIAAYNQDTYNPGDRLISGRGEEGQVIVEVTSTTSRRRPQIPNGYRCRDCGNLYDRQRDLNLHARTHNPQQECPHCESRFVSRREVVRHVDSVHRNSRPYHCQRCSSAFARKDNLDRHVSTVHRGLRRANPQTVVVHNRPLPP